MKKKVLPIFIFCIAAAFTFAACGESCAAAQLTFGAKMPWDMPRLYEKCVYSVEEYTMLEINGLSTRD